MEVFMRVFLIDIKTFRVDLGGKEGLEEFRCFRKISGSAKLVLPTSRNSHNVCPLMVCERVRTQETPEVFWCLKLKRNHGGGMKAKHELKVLRDVYD